MGSFDSNETMFIFSVGELPHEQLSYWQELFKSLGDFLLHANEKGEYSTIEFYAQAVVFNVLDILLQRRDSVCPVDIINFYHDCVTDAMCEMVLSDIEILKRLLLNTSQ